MTNLGRVQLLHTPCEAPPCAALLRLARPLWGRGLPPFLWGTADPSQDNPLRAAAQVEGAPPRVLEHAALVAFAAGERAQAGELLATAEAAVSGAAGNGATLSWPPDSPERHLAQAYRLLEAGRPAEAATAFQLAQPTTRPFWTTADFDHYEQALAHMWTARADDGALQRYWAAFFQWRSGDTATAEALLRAAPVETAELRTLGTALQQPGATSAAQLLAARSVGNPAPTEPSVWLHAPQQPDHAAPLTMGGGWQLVGFDLLAQPALEAGTTLPLALWWQPGAGDATVACLALGAYCVTAADVVNLAPNAGFSQTADGQATVPGYPFNPFDGLTVRHRPSWPHAVVTAAGPRGAETAVAQIATAADFPRSGLRSYGEPIDGATPLVVSAAVRVSEGGAATLGCTWTGPTVDYAGGAQWGFVGSDLTNREWMRYAAGLTPAVGATACAVTLLNRGAPESAVWFDDLIVFALEDRLLPEGALRP